MKKFKFNEQSAIEKMIKSNFVDENNVTNTIYSLAKYNYHALQLNDKENYNFDLSDIIILNSISHHAVASASSARKL